MGKTTGRDLTTQKRWAEFLTSMISGPVTIAKLGELLSQMPHRSFDSDSRAALYAFLKQTRTVKAPLAFDVGEAIRTCAIDHNASDRIWCSGAASLAASGIISDFVRIVGGLDAAGDREHAVYLATLVPIAIEREEELHGYVSAARLLLEKLGVDGQRTAFERGSTRGWNSLLKSAAEFSDSSASLELLEPAVYGVLREWALDAASGHLRRLLVAPIIERDIERLRSSIAAAQLPNDLASRIMDGLEIDAPRHAARKKSK